MRRWFAAQTVPMPPAPLTLRSQRTLRVDECSPGAMSAPSAAVVSPLVSCAFASGRMSFSKRGPFARLSAIARVTCFKCRELNFSGVVAMRTPLAPNERAGPIGPALEVAPAKRSGREFLAARRHGLRSSHPSFRWYWPRAAEPLPEISHQGTRLPRSRCSLWRLEQKPSEVPGARGQSRLQPLPIRRRQHRGHEGRFSGEGARR